MKAAAISIPNHTAVRVALWRALHLEIDAPPHVLEDEIGLKLAPPEEGWRQRPDMHPQNTRGYRASIVARARFIEDLVLERLRHGVHQCIILGAGLDTFAQRKPVSASHLEIFEIDAPETQQWKRRRLMDLGYGVPSSLHLVPVDFEAGDHWSEKLKASGFQADRPAIACSAGLAMYLTHAANVATLRQVASFVPGSTLAMTFMLPPNLVDSAERPQYEMVIERARAAGTPFQSFFRPQELLDLARDAGFRDIRHISRSDLIQSYFECRTDGLAPASGEEILVAST